MKKLAIILDSFAKNNAEEITNKEDQYFLPLKIIVDGKEYEDGVDVKGEEALKMVMNGKDVKTSLPSPGDMEGLFKRLSEEYENVIYLPLGPALSGTYQSAILMAQEFPSVHVVLNRFVGGSFEEICNYLRRNNNKDINELIKFIREYASELETFVIPKNIDAFIKGGRLNKAMAFVLEKLKQVPIISYDSDEKLHKKMVKRSGSKAYKWGVAKIEDSLDENTEYIWDIEHTIDQEYALELKALLESKGYEVYYSMTSSIIAAHTGDGAFSIGVYKKIKD